MVFHIFIACQNCWLIQITLNDLIAVLFKFMFHFDLFLNFKWFLYFLLHLKLIGTNSEIIERIFYVSEVSRLDLLIRHSILSAYEFLKLQVAFGKRCLTWGLRFNNLWKLEWLLII